MRVVEVEIEAVALVVHIGGVYLRLEGFGRDRVGSYGIVRFRYLAQLRLLSRGQVHAQLAPTFWFLEAKAKNKSSAFLATSTAYMGV